jgi:hypothetical protein
MSGPGKVNFRGLNWKEYHQRTRRIRWRQLKSRTLVHESGAPVYICIFGYGAYPDATPEGPGPWFGYTKEGLRHVPCTHCGQTELFHQVEWNHECPGKFKGKKLPCEDPHPCKGEPSMASAPCWRHVDWIEIDIFGHNQP